MDLWGHNPFTLRRPDLRQPKLGSGYADFSDLDVLVRALDRAMKRSPRGQRRLRVFISEFALPTDSRNWQFNFYVSRDIQADWIRRALRIVRPWKRIYTFGYLGLYDEGPRPANDQARWGLIDEDGRHKPAYSAFRDG